MSMKPIVSTNLTTIDPSTRRGFVRLKLILDLTEVAKPPAPHR
jgi:hypothetical protein